MSRILLVDDDAALREGVAELVEDLGHEPVQAGDGEQALRHLAGGEKVDAVLLDLRMPGLDGIAVLRRIRALAEAPPVAVLTAVATADNTIEAMRLGAVDHLTKPVGREALSALLAGMLSVAAPPAGPRREPPREGDFIGGSAPMRALQKAIGRVAGSDASILITGETGTGKEVVAQALHRYGTRSSGPFVAINCAAIPAELLESQLFGHVRGAFTGALADRLGSVREADGGTLFLDEIGDMDLVMQAKLLRVLQERVVVPVGGKGVKVDIRLVSATHRDLIQAVAEGRFRQDLYYRLAVVPLHLPPLRERLADIVPLAEHFLALAAPELQLSAGAASRLMAHGWPGNVRELRNAVERAAALGRHAGGGALPASAFDFLLPVAALAQDDADWLAGTLPEAVARLETAMMRRALDACGGNRSDAARRLGINRQLLYDKLRRYGLDDAVSG